MNKVLIQADQLSVQFEQKIVFQNLSFAITQGDFFCITGPNGSGKTTLLRVILKQLLPTKGQLIEHVSLNQIGYVPQFRNLDEDYPLAAKDFVTLKLSHSLRPWLTTQEKKQVRTALTRVHLLQKQTLRMGQMSGGEKQRAYLAQAIVDQPQLLILDEPTASLDEQAKFEVMDVVGELNQQGTTVIFITHDPELLQHYGQTKRLELQGRD